MSTAPQSLTLDQLVDLREKTERLSAFLGGRLRAHLSTLYPILAPKRIFGKYVGSRDAVPRAEEAYAQLTERYKESAGAPFDLRSDLDDQALSAMEYGVEIYPWEYTHDVGGKAITMTSPVRWVVTYKSDHSLSHMRALVARKGEKKALPIRQFMANALALHTVVSRTPGLASLLEDLRYQVRVEPLPGLGKLTALTLGFPMPSFRPPDDLILSATRFSGVPAFIELVDPATTQDIPDPVRLKVEATLNA